MIGFKQFLAEARMAPLYHGTDISNLLQILNGGLLPKTLHLASRIQARKLPPTGEVKSDKGVSLTRSKHFAVRFARELARHSSDELCVIELDQQRLAQRYKIVPINYWSTSTRVQGNSPLNEFEEFVVTAKPIPPSMFTTIWVPKDVWQDDYLLSSRDRQLVVDMAKRHNTKVKFL